MTKVLIVGRDDIHTKRIGNVLATEYEVQTLEVKQLTSKQLKEALTSETSLIVVLGISDKLSEIFNLTTKPVVVFSMGYDLNMNKMSKQLSETLRNCTGIVLDCNFHYELMVKIGIPESKLLSIPYGCDYKFFTKNSPKISDLPRILLNRGDSLNHGNHIAIQALENLKSLNINFVATFIGDHFLNEHYENLLKELKKSGHVKVIASVDQKELLENMSENWVYLSGSLSDGTSVSLLEAMSAGLIPVVSDWATNLEWIVDDYNGLVFENGDSKSLTFALIRLTTLTENEKDLMSGRSKRIISKRADWDANAKALIEFIRLKKGNDE
jgi:glycosyltransferase involved in cell wall biosynthesis